MDMSKDEPSMYVPMQEQIDAIKYADIQPSPYESPYQQDVYQEQGLACQLQLTGIHFPVLYLKRAVTNSAHWTQEKNYGTCMGCT